MTLIENMEIYENQLSGTIPEQLYDLTKLTSLDVNLCRLTGTLSTKIGQLSKMQRFRVSTNDLTGTIPTEVSKLTSSGRSACLLFTCHSCRVANKPFVRISVLFWFHKTRFTGSVPESLCRFRPNPLIILQADCHPVGNPAVPCLCCSHCCNRDDGICLSAENEG